MSRAATLRVPLRWRDLDVLGHMYQGRYHELLDEARAAIFAPMAGRLGFPFVLVRIELDYRREVTRADGALDLRSRVSAIGASSVTIDHEFALPDGQVVASGRSIMVAWRSAGRRAGRGDGRHRTGAVRGDDARRHGRRRRARRAHGQRRWTWGFTAAEIERLRADGVIS